MDFNRLIETVLRMILRRSVNYGIKRGIRAASGKSKTGAGKTGAGKAMTAAERQQSEDARAVVKRARQAARLTRRIGR